MTTENELKLWLRRPDKTFVENLNFGIKAWDSVEFVLLSKYEIIMEYLIENLDIFKDQEIWKIIQEFLNLHFPASSISMAVKLKLIEKFIYILEKKVKKPQEYILKCLLTLFHHKSMWSFYKNHIEVFMKFTGGILLYYGNLIKIKEFDTDDDKKIKEMLEYLNEYSKLMSTVSNFQTILIENIYNPLTKFILVLKSLNHNYDQFWLNLFVILMENINTIEKFNEFTEINRNLDKFLILQTIEGFLRTNLFPSEQKTKLAEFLILNNQNFILYRENDLIKLKSLNYIILALKKYNIELENTDLIIESIDQLIDDMHHEHPNEILSIICSFVKYNPNLIKTKIIDYLIVYMFKRKNDELLILFYEFLYLVIDMFNKLYQTKVFILNLNAEVENYLKDHRLSKKLKRKHDDHSIVGKTAMDGMDKNLIILWNSFNENSEIISNSSNLNDYQWTDIEYAWPVKIVGKKIIQSISNLVSKLSLNVWHTLLYQFEMVIKNLKQVDQLDENFLFQIDFLTVFLCHYLAGNRLIENYDKIKSKIDIEIVKMTEFLKLFGQKLLNFEHNTRLMNDYLQICFYFGNFECLIYYYCPDSMNSLTNPDWNNDTNNDLAVRLKSKLLHDYLTPEEWVLIEQRIINFGKSDCIKNLNRLKLQKSRGYALTIPVKKKLQIIGDILPSTLNEIDQIISILNDNSTNLWFIENLSIPEKIQIIETLLKDYFENDTAAIDNEETNKIFNLNRNLYENQEFIQLFIILLYQKISLLSFKSKKAIMRKIDFGLLLKLGAQDIKYLTKFLLVENQLQDDAVGKLKKYDLDVFKKCYKILKQLPILSLSKEDKNIVFCLNLSTLIDAKATEEEEMSDICMEFFRDMMSFHDVDGVRLLGFEFIYKIFNNLKDSATIFKSLLRDSKTLSSETCNEVFKQILDLYKKAENSQFLIEILMSTCHQFLKQSTSTKSFAKTKKLTVENRLELIKTIFDYLKEIFLSKKSKEKKKLENEKKIFLEKTIMDFSFTLKLYIDTNEPNFIIPNEIKQIIKIYIENSINFNNLYTLDLLKILIELKQESISNSFNHIFDKFWKLFIEENIEADLLNDSKLIDVDFDRDFHMTEKNLIKVNILTVFFEKKSIKEFVLLLNEILAMMKDEKNFGRVLNLLVILAGCQYEKEKNFIFAEFLRRVTSEIILRTSSQQLLTENVDLAINLLTTYNVFASNQNNHFTVSQIDNILSFIFFLNITKFNTTNENRTVFINVLWNIIELCINLNRNCNEIIVNRLPQFVGIIKLLLQTICWYGLNTNENYKLNNLEIIYLSKLSHKMEKLIFYLMKKGNDVRPLVPYLITFIINLMITKSNPTTMNPQIKAHFTNMCYSAISVIQDNMRGFILRVSGDAGRKVYENLVKDYVKYRKFKGSS